MINFTEFLDWVFRGAGITLGGVVIYYILSVLSGKKKKGLSIKFKSKFR